MESEEAMVDRIRNFDEGGAKLIVIVVGLFMCAFVFGNMLHKFNVSIIPESLVLIMLGACLGYYFLHSFEDFNLMNESFLNATVLNLFLLPLIIFEAGWSLKHKDFIAQLGYILIFAIFGTIICMVVVAGLVKKCTEHLSWGISSWRVAFTYGALISAVDPVATLSTYTHLNVEPLLNILVLGESIVNDAVAITLFRALNDPTEEEFNAKSLADVVTMVAGQTVKLLFGSIGFGVALGCGYILVLRFAHMRHSPALEILFCLLSSFLTYSLAEISGFSGIIATLFCAMLMSAYATPHLTMEGRFLTAFLLKQLASLGDMTVFLFVGITLVFVSMNGLKMGLCMMLFCVVGRFVATFPLGLVTNCIKSVMDRDVEPEHRTTLSWKHLFMMWHGGLRGGIALVLTLQLGKWVTPREREQLRNATLIIICSFLFIFGGSTQFFLNLLEIPLGSEAKDMKHKNGCLRRSITWIEKWLIEPVLVGSDAKVELHMQHGGIVAAVQAHNVQDKKRRSTLQAQVVHDTKRRSSVGLNRISRVHADFYDLYGAISPGECDWDGDSADLWDHSAAITEPLLEVPEE